MSVYSNMVNIIMFRPVLTVKYCVCGYLLTCRYPDSKLTPERICRGGITSGPERSPLAQRNGSGTDKDCGSRLDPRQTLSVSADKAAHPLRIRSGPVPQPAQPCGAHMGLTWAI
jgi:hypothetical protein